MTPQQTVKPEKRTDTVVLNEIRAVMNDWNSSAHKWRSANAIGKINGILEARP